MASHLANVSYLIEYEYIAIAGLPGEIIELMKEPAKRSEVVKELLKGMSTVDTKKVLSYHKKAFSHGSRASRERQIIPKLVMLPFLKECRIYQTW